MGGDPAPFWANLFLFYFESTWIKRMRKNNNILARKFSHTFRYIDDLLAINDGGMFERFHKDIYPKELELKKENTNSNTCSNIPKKMCLSSIVAEVLRIARVTSNFQPFLASVQILIRRMLSQGAHIVDIRTSTHKIIKKHWDDFEKYSLTSKGIISSIFT